MNFNDNIPAAHLVLENGTVFHGKSMGKIGKSIGEVVFGTSMVGYQETLTDPSNAGLMFTQTFPLIGNYGVNKYCNESGKTYLNGYIVREICDAPSNFRSEGTLGDFLKDNNIVGIYGIDTRKLTRIIREKGVMKGMITDSVENIDSIVTEIKAFQQPSPLDSLSKETTVFDSCNGNGNCKSKKSVAVVNLGVKSSLINALCERGCTVTVVPYDATDFSGFDGVVISDGASDPLTYDKTISAVKILLDKKVPLLGIGLGHHIMAIAGGCTVKKMHYGHRGSNQPVMNLLDQKTYITTQNHGYVVESIEPNISEAIFINANDKSVEGLTYKNSPAISVQFTPDAKFTMVSTSFVYDNFIKMMGDDN